MLSILLFYYAQLSQGNYTKDIIRDYIVIESLIIGVDPQIALGVAERESRFNPDSVGDKGTSFGLYQIHLPAHPDITKEQALDPIFSTEWSLKEMKRNGCKIWSTCLSTTKAIKSQSSSISSQPEAYKSQGDS